MENQKLNQLKQGVKLPVIMAPMFLVSNPKMVIEGCEAGIIGTFPALNARTEEVLDEWMTEINQAMKELEVKNGEAPAPWGVNFISHRTNKRYEEDLALIKKHQPPLVITSLGDPSPVVKIVHSYGGVVLSDVIDMTFARKAIEKGSDGLILVAAGAGGHAGRLNPIAFMREVREFFDGPLVLAGTMSRGEDIVLAETLGADFAYIGTKFIATKESDADETYIKTMLDSTIDDIIYTPAFSGIHANYLTKSIVNAGLKLEDLPEEGKFDSSQMENTNARAWKDILGAGQGVGTVKDVKSVKELTSELQEQYKTTLKKIISTI